MIIYAINYGLGVFGPEMAMDFGSTKWNRCLMSGLPTDSPLLGWIEIGPCVFQAKYCLNWMA